MKKQTRSHLPVSRQLVVDIWGTSVGRQCSHRNRHQPSYHFHQKWELNMRYILANLIMPVLCCVLSIKVVDAEPLKIAKDARQLFLDDQVVQRIEGLRRITNQATKSPNNPVVRREHPWEQFRAMIYGTVLYDEQDQLFKMWYTCMPHNNTQPAVKINGENRVPWVTLIAYATSTDGVHWNKPTLAQLDFNGTKHNNLVDVGRDNVEGIAILPNQHSVDPARRWLAFFWEHRSFRADDYEVPPYENPTDGDWDAGMWVAYSPDGLHWTNHGRVISGGSDTHQTVVYDPDLQKYVCFNRLGAGGRKIGRCDSKDFLNWSDAKRVFQGDEQDRPRTQVYGMSVVVYEGVYVGLPWLFYPDGVIDIKLAFSRDGHQWQRPEDRSQVIVTGKAGSWDAVDFRMGNSIVVRDDKIFIYYCAAAGGHPTGDVVAKIDKYSHEYHQKYRSMHIGLATLRRDGWVSLDAGPQPGKVVTRLLRWPGGKLHVNVDAEEGELQVVVRDASGTAVAASPPIVGDFLEKPVNLDGDALPLDEPVTLEFQLKSGKLFSFWWE